MAAIDIVILAVIALLAFLGYKRGLIRELAGIIALILGSLLAWKLSPALGEVFLPEDWSPMAKTPIAAIAVVILTFIAVHVSVYLLRKILFHGPLKTIDKNLGALFGALKGIILVIIALTIIIVSPMRKDLREWSNGAPVTKALTRVIEPIVDNLTGELKKKAKKIAGELFDKNEDKLNNAFKVEIASLIEKFGQEEISNINFDQIDTLSPETKKLLLEYLENQNNEPKSQPKSVSTHSKDRSGKETQESLPF